MDARRIVVFCFLAGTAALILPAAPAAADKLYKWTDQAGKVHYTDMRPTEQVRTQERRKFGDRPADVELPYSLLRAVVNFPVTLFTSDTGCAEACGKAVKHLKDRGIPFTEKNARDSAGAEEVKAANAGKLEVPFLKIGKQFIRGYQENEWNTALDAAGYPKTAVASASTIKASMKYPVPPPNGRKPTEDAKASAWHRKFR